MPRYLMDRQLVLATHNRGKLAELAELLAPHGIATIGAPDLGLVEPEEGSVGFTENAALKAREAAKASGLPALADDSGFCVSALDGAPGVVTADWATAEGGGRDYGLGMRRVAEAIRASGREGDRRAWFVCVLALGWPDGHVEAFEGRIDGEWVWPPRGERGHGFDPMFRPAGHGLTFGEMEPLAKSLVSHRAVAFAGFLSVVPRRG